MDLTLNSTSEDLKAVLVYSTGTTVIHFKNSSTIKISSATMATLVSLWDEAITRPEPVGVAVNN